MTKQEYQNELITDPDYDADWIDVVSDMFSKYDMDFIINVIRIDLNSLSKLSDRKIHIINGLIDLIYRLEPKGKKYEYNLDLMTTFIQYLVKGVHKINHTQAQLIAAIIDSKVRNSYETGQSFDSDLLGEIIEANIPYASLNFIAKSIINGHNELLQYVNSDPEVINELYAIIEDGLFDTISKIMNFDGNVSNKELLISPNTLRLVRFLYINNIDFDNSRDNIIIKK